MRSSRRNLIGASTVTLPRTFLRVASSLAITLAAPHAFGTTITFYNTGEASDGSALAAGVNDPHYSLVSNPTGSTQTAIATQRNSAWVAPPANSGWISPGASGNSSWASGSYTYETSIDLTGFNASSAIFTGSIAADDSVSIYLNHSSTAAYTATNGFSSLASFSINGFQRGVNVIDFVVVNQSGPSGLLVTGSVTAQPLTIAAPEPSTFVLVASGGLVTLTGVRRRQLAFHRLQEVASC